MSTDTDETPLLERALAAAAERDRQRAEIQAARELETIERLRRDAVTKLAMILDDDPDHEIPEARVDELREIVESWEIERSYGGGQPVALVGRLEGIPLGLVPDPERTYGTVIVAARFGEVDGIRYLSTSYLPIRTLADVPDALGELDGRLAEEAEAIRRELDEDDRRMDRLDEVATVCRPSQEEADAAAAMLAAIRSLSAEGLLEIAEVDLETAARVAPMVAAAQLERIADHLDVETGEILEEADDE